MIFVSSTISIGYKFKYIKSFKDTLKKHIMTLFRLILLFLLSLFNINLYLNQKYQLQRQVELIFS